MISRNHYKTSFTSEDGKTVLPEDYLYFLNRYEDINTRDILLAFAELMRPELTVYEGRIFLKDRFFLYEKRKDNYKNIEEAQYWVNFIEITELYEDISDDEAKMLGSLMVKNWNDEIIAKYGRDQGLAELLVDDELGEVYVTIL